MSNNSLTKYNNSILKRIRSYFKIRRFEKTIKANKIKFEKIDNQNIDDVLNNPQKFDLPKSNYPNDFDPPINKTDVINIILNFYDDLDPEIGAKMRSLYKLHENEIFIYPYSKAEGGVSFPSAHKFEDGKEGICRINFKNNYLTLFNAAHEFNHLLLFSLGKENEQLSEVNPRFIELALADYLVDNNIITEEQKNEHINANTNIYENAKRLNDLREIYSILEMNGRFNRNAINQLLAHCNGNFHKLENIMSYFERVFKGPEINRPKNNLRFINATVGSITLHELYKKDKISFIKNYKDILFDRNELFHKYNYEAFFKDIEAKTEVPSIPSKDGIDIIEKNQDIDRID